MIHLGEGFFRNRRRAVFGRSRDLQTDGAWLFLSNFVQGFNDIHASELL